MKNKYYFFEIKRSIICKRKKYKKFISFVNREDIGELLSQELNLSFQERDSKGKYYNMWIDEFGTEIMLKRELDKFLDKGFAKFYNCDGKEHLLCTVDNLTEKDYRRIKKSKGTYQKLMAITTYERYIHSRRI